MQASENIEVCKVQEGGANCRDYYNTSRFLFNKKPSEGLNFLILTVNMFCKKDAFKFFRKLTGTHLCWNLFLMNFVKKETPTQVFSCGFWEILKSTYFSIQACRNRGGYSPSRFLLNSIFYELKEIVLKRKIIKNYKTS